MIKARKHILIEHFIHELLNECLFNSVTCNCLIMEMTSRVIFSSRRIPSLANLVRSFTQKT